MTATERHPADVTADEIPAETIVRWHAAIADELRDAFEACLPGSRFTLGPRLRAFEETFAAYCDCSSAIGVSSGTAALQLGLRALGVQPGDEVITVPNTYVATAFAISYVGAVPVFVDVDPVTGNMDPARVGAALSERTKAIIPVHLWGQAVDVDAVRAAAPGVPLLEDAAHAHGATYRGRKVGSLRLINLWPFPDELFTRRAVYLVVELNWDGQLVREVQRAAPKGSPVHFLGSCGDLPTQADLEEAFENLLTNRPLTRKGWTVEAW